MHNISGAFLRISRIQSGVEKERRRMYKRTDISIAFARPSYKFQAKRAKHSAHRRKKNGKNRQKTSNIFRYLYPVRRRDKCCSAKLLMPILYFPGGYLCRSNNAGMKSAFAPFFPTFVADRRDDNNAKTC